MAPLMTRFQRLAPAARAGLTSCVIMSAGDVICQAIQRRNKPAPYDWQRTARFGLVGLTLHGPYFLWGFRMLDERFGPAKTLLTAAKKTATGQLTLFPTYVAAFFTYITLLETGGDLAAVGDKLRASFVKTYAVGSLFWPVANMFNFMFLPPSARLLYVNCAGLAWNAILSSFNSAASKESAAAAVQQQQQQAVVAVTKAR